MQLASFVVQHAVVTAQRRPFSGSNVRPAAAGRTRRATGRVACNAQQQSDSQSGWGGSPLSIFCPLLKLFSGGDAAAPRNRWLEVASSGLASMSRLPFGTTVGPAAANRSSEPLQPLRIYEFEACPFCRRVREAITDLDLEVEVYPTPKGAERHRQVVMEAGGKEMFPFLVDPNTGTELYESDAIVSHLYQHYGEGIDPPQGLLISTLITGWVPTLLRAGRGMLRYAGAQSAPEQLLTLYDYDGNQFSRLVREALCELELPYRRLACGKGSKRRPQLKQLAGSTQVPYMQDPNTGAAIQDSEEAVAYLFRTYGGADGAAGT